MGELKQLAVKTPFPPDGFTIQSVQQIAKRAAGRRRPGFAAQHPDLALWRLIRTTLQGDGGPGYFDQSMKDALLPPQSGDFKQFKGKVVSQASPKELLVSVDKPEGDATLVFAAPVRGKIEPGLEIEFSGVVESYTKQPFNVRFTVEKKDVTGLAKR